MLFKTDENIPLEAVHLLRAAGHDTLTVFDQSLGGRPDSRIASVCRREAGALITLDTDFGTTTCQNLVFLRKFPREDAVKPGNTNDYVSRKDAEIAKVHVLAVLCLPSSVFSSYRS